MPESSAPDTRKSIAEVIIVGIIYGVFALGGLYVVFTLCALGSTDYTPTTHTCFIEYKVQPGDTLESIAKKYDPVNYKKLVPRMEIQGTIAKDGGVASGDVVLIPGCNN